MVVDWLGRAGILYTVGTYSDLSAKAVLKGIFGDNSVLRADLLGPLNSFQGVRTLDITPAQFSALLHEIANDLRLDTPALRVSTDAHPGAFFVATGRFHIFQTCNQWVGQTLRAAGVKFGAWTPLPASVRLSLWRFGQASG